MTQSSDDFYLPEDKDILDSLDTLGPMSTGTALSEQQRKLQELQIRATLRSRKTANSMSKSTTWYSIVLGIFAMIQIIIMASQFMFDAFTSDHQWVALGVTVVCVGLILLILKHFDPEKIVKD